MKKLVIGRLNPVLPAMQGALGYISSASFVAAVASEGAMGNIASLGLTPEQLLEQIKAVRKLCKRGDIFGINLLVHSEMYSKLLEVCVDERVDFVELAGGIDKECGLINKDGGPEVICKVSSLRLAMYSEQLGAAAVTVMGKEAGGHLGFPEGVPFISTADLVREVKNGTGLTVIAAGGAVDTKSARDLFDAGADGVQIGTRLMATVEFESHPGVLSTGLGRGTGREAFDTSGCVECLSECARTFCLRKAIRRAAAGDVEKGVVPASENTPRIKKVLPLQQVLSDIASSGE
jgi:NAD(P)H-dependent flavin oxidoreductase YrpB (nitropropane dioxygenase family)